MPNTPLVYHHDTALFHDAIRYTAAETGFSQRLIEKDYYCSVGLVYVTALSADIIFKGGTCLGKVHAGFYRLSEDLDFAMSMPIDATRGQRSRRIESLKTQLAEIESSRDTALQVVDPLRGFNNSMQYCGTLAYRSLITGQDDFIKIEVSIREPVVEQVTLLPARTLLLDPFRRAAAIPAVEVAALTIRETYAEKIRAALSRADPAIRDFFDLDHAFSLGTIDMMEAQMLKLLRKKLSISGYDAMDISPGKLEILKSQLETHLKPVLRAEDYSRFDLEQAFGRVADIAALL